MRRERVRDVRHYLTREAFLTSRVDEGEGYGVSRVRHHSPVPPVPAIRTTVEGVQAAVVVETGMERLVVDGERTVADAVGVAAWYSVEMRMPGGMVIGGRVVEAKNNVALYALDVLNEEIGEAGAVGNEEGSYAFVADFVFPIR